MIKVTKYTDISLSIVGIGSEILKILKNDYIQTYSEVLAKIVDRKGESAKENFSLALSFLFLMGKIRYHQRDGGIIEYLKNN